MVCSKCKGNHQTRTCSVPWPFWTDQVCDICLNPDHEASRCDKGGSIFQCTICGHCDHHNTRLCHIKDPKNHAHVNQWTKSKYAKVKGSGPGLQSIPIRQGNSSAASGQASSSSSQPPTRNDPTDQAETSSPERIEVSDPTKDAKEREAYEWAHPNLPQVAISTDIKRPVAIYSNFVKVNFDNVSNIRKYRIVLGNIDGKEVAKKEVKQALISKFLHKQRKPTSDFWTTDYVSHIISVGPLYKELEDKLGYGWMMGHRRTPRPGQEPPVMESTIVFEGIFDKVNLDKWVTKKLLPTNPRRDSPSGGSSGRDSTVYSPDQDLRILNLASWTYIHKRLITGGLHGKKFYPDDWDRRILLRRKEPGANVDARNDAKKPSPVYVLCKGYFTSMRPGISCIGLNINPATTAFYPDIILSDWVKEKWINRDGPPPLSGRSELKNLRVEFIHDKQPAKKRVVRGFGEYWMENTFFKPGINSEETISVYDHMVAKYTKPFNKFTYVVNVGSTTPGKEIWYPADKLCISKWQAVKGLLDDDFKSEMLKVAERSPQNLRNDIRSKAFPPLGINPNGPDSTDGAQLYKNFGLRLQGDLTALQARYLARPTIRFSKSGNVQTINLQGTQVKDGNRGSWNLNNVKFLKPGRTIRLETIRIDRQRDVFDEYMKIFRNQFVKDLRKYGLTVHVGSLQNIDLSDLKTREEVELSLSRAYDRTGDPRQGVVMVILPSKDATLYANVKWWGDCSRGVPTVCVTDTAIVKKQINKHKQVQRHQDSDTNEWVDTTDVMLLGNLCMKVNFKTGGTNQSISAEPWYGARTNTMIVGADVSHTGKGANPTCPSMAGVVATTDSDSGQYLASARLQENNTEFIAGLDGIIRERMNAFYKNNGQEFPDHILFYRDGVSEGQYGMVQQKELPLIREGCRQAALDQRKSADFCPKITLLVVGKRHHARFFRNSYTGITQKGHMNLYSGLVVDDTVVDPTCGNFYLQSHDSYLGTAKSGHYVVISNESNYTLDELENLTNRICYTGSRATKCLSVCTPARYADILCDRLRCYMRSELKTPPQSGEQLKDYEAGITSWRTHGNQARTNPWYPSLDDVMFYL